MQVVVGVELELIMEQVEQEVLVVGEMVAQQIYLDLQHTEVQIPVVVVEVVGIMEVERVPFNQVLMVVQEL
jgi:hypothetical protein